MLSLVDRAVVFAKVCHRQQRRKYTGEPYIVHPLAVMGMVKEAGLDENVQAAAVLHDVIEDCGVTWKDLAILFNDRVADLVEQVSDVSRPSDGNRAARKALDRAHLANSDHDGASIKLADFDHNTKDIMKNDPDFGKVYLREKRQTLPLLRHGHPYLYQQAYETMEKYRSHTLTT